MIEKRIQAILGTEGVIDIDDHGCVEVSPSTEEECALILTAAHDSGWKVRFSGCGSWLRADAPADLAITTHQLTGITDLNPADLVLTARAGTALNDLQGAAANDGTWIAIDPPGVSRSLGSVLATGTAGPLRTGFGAVKSRILGLTLITADGRIVRVGGRVVKNVAGFNLTSLAVGSFGAFGLITSAHIRLNALPECDITLNACAPRDTLLDGARAILASGVTPASLELFSYETLEDENWTLAVRIVGSETAVAADKAMIAESVSQIDFVDLNDEEANRFWESTSSKPTEHPTTVRMGSLPSELGKAIDELTSQLAGDGNAFVSVSVLAGVTRWSGETASQQLNDLRLSASRHDWPVTLERAPWTVRNAVGHYGAYGDQVDGLVASMRTVFDSRSVLVVPLGSAL